jgi:integrase
MKEKLTDKLAAKAGPGIHWDTDDKAPRGFLLRVTPAGARAWCLNYRIKNSGRMRRLTIGDVASWPVAAARERAAELRRVVDAGGDPLGAAEAKRAEPTVAELIAQFEREALPSRAPRSQVEYKSMLRDWILPAIGRLKVSAVTRQDVEKLFRKITAEGKLARANAVKSLVSTLFTQALEWGMRSDNPASGIKGNDEAGRERFLTPQELARLLATLDSRPAHEADAVDIIRLAVLTGARRGEILGMAWAQVDLEAGVWTKPAATTKQRKLHRVPLSPEAVAVLQRRREQQGVASGRVVRLRDDQVFRAGTSKTGGNALEHEWRSIRAAAGLEDVRFHDLRHSFASWLVASGLSLPIIGAMLGHSKAATTERYAHLADAPLRNAAEIVGRIVGKRK